MNECCRTSFAIRDVRDSDRIAIDDLLRHAFEGEEEALLVRKLNADGDVVLERVAVIGDKIVAHILFSRLWIEQNGRRISAVALAPLAVLPEMQGQGLGVALVEDAHHILITGGERVAVVLGDPAYYSRFGYELALASGFKSPYPAQYLQAKCLNSENENLLLQGKLHYASAFGDH